MPERKEFAQLLTQMTIERTRLVWLYVEALMLEREGRHHPCDRLRAVEKVLLVSLSTVRQKASLGKMDEKELEAIEKDFGVSRQWIVDGSIKALKAGIEAHCGV